MGRNNNTRMPPVLSTEEEASPGAIVAAGEAAQHRRSSSFPKANNIKKLKFYYSYVLNSPGCQQGQTEEAAV